MSSDEYRLGTAKITKRHTKNEFSLVGLRKVKDGLKKRFKRTGDFDDDLSLY